MNTTLVVAVAATSAACSAALVWYSLRTSASKIAKDELKALAKIEREGRVRLQIALGAAQDRIKLLEAATPSADSKSIPLVTFPTIGVISSPYSTRNGTPRQPSLVESSLAKLVLHKHIPTTTLISLAEFSHVWVLFHFHQNTNVHKDKIKGTIKPPRLNGQSVGVLATRSPHRPAALGLSLAKVVEVNVAKGYVLFQGLDLVHATPVVDIKPYVAFSDAPDTGHFAPSWVGKEHAEADEPLKISQVVFASAAAQASLEKAYAVCKSTRRKKSGISLYPTFDLFAAFVKENLSLDMRSTRERADPKFDSYRVTLCDVMVYYSVVANEQDPEVHIHRGEVLSDKWQQPLNETAVSDAADVVAEDSIEQVDDQ